MELFGSQTSPTSFEPSVPVKHFDAPPTTAHQPQSHPDWQLGLQLPPTLLAAHTGVVFVIDVQTVGVST
jgi:hypothetical protein